MGIGLLEKMIEYCDQMYSDYQCDECTGHNCRSEERRVGEECRL